MGKKLDRTGVRSLTASLFGTAAEYWWVWLVAGIAWLSVAIVVLQFNQSSATTVGIVVGIIFLAGAVQTIAIGRTVDGARWIWYSFGVVLAAGSLTSLVYPGKTFVIVSAVVGALLVASGLFWVARAYSTRHEDPLWPMWIVLSVAIVGVGIWLAGQFITVRALTITAVTGVWALVKGVKDLAKAAHLRRYYLSAD